MTAAISLDRTTVHSPKLVLPVRYVAGSSIIQTSSTALSVDAIHVRSVRPPRLGAQLSITVYFPITGEQITRAAIVTWVTAGSNAGFWAEFTSDDARAAMTAMLGRLRASGDRRCPRFQTRLEATVHERGGRASSSGEIANISRSGAFIRLSTPPALGSIIDLDLELPGRPLPDSVDAQVIHVAPGQGVGVQFIGASDMFGTHLDEYLAGLQRAPAKAQSL